MRPVLLTFAAAFFLPAPLTFAGPTVTFSRGTLILHTVRRVYKIRDVIDSRPFYTTVHAVHRRRDTYYVVFGNSEWSRGYPPRDGLCGSGIESDIRWLAIRDGEIVDEQKGLHESCFKNRSSGPIAWKKHKLVWVATGPDPDREVDPTGVTFHWEFDPKHPEKGIVEKITR